MKTGIVLFALVVCIASTFGDDDKSKTLHKKMIARRREEHFVLMRNLAKNPNFEMRHRLLVVALDKIYELIQINRDLLEKESDAEKITEPKLILVENSCLLMDFIVNFSFDRMIYTVMKKLKNDHWYGDLRWCMKFLENHLDLLDELTTKEYEFVLENMSKIINEEQLPEYKLSNNIKEFLPDQEQVKEYKKKAKERRKNAPHLTDRFEL